jgi:hypothetical protein
VLITGNGSMKPNVFPLDGRVVVDIPGVVLKTALPGNVIAPVKGMRAGKHKDKLRLVLDLKEKTDFDFTSAGNLWRLLFLKKRNHILLRTWRPVEKPLRHCLYRQYFQFQPQVLSHQVQSLIL